MLISKLKLDSVLYNVYLSRNYVFWACKFPKIILQGPYQRNDSLQRLQLAIDPQSDLNLQLVSTYISSKLTFQSFKLLLYVYMFCACQFELRNKICFNHYHLLV